MVSFEGNSPDKPSNGWFPLRDSPSGSCPDSLLIAPARLSLASTISPFRDTRGEPMFEWMESGKFALLARI